MPTANLTAETLGQTVHGNGIVPVDFAAPGALPASAFEQLISAVQGLDMDVVRAQIAAQQLAS